MGEANFQLTASYLCDMCKKFIEDELKALAGVESAIAEVSNRQLTVQFDEQLVAVEKIEEVAHKYGCHLRCWYWTDERYKKIPVNLHI